MNVQESFDLQQLFTFYISANSRTFTEASERLHISQSAVSHAIRKLEHSAGFELLVRDRAPVRLTTRGRLLVEACGRVFGDLRRCREAMRQGDSTALAGRLRAGATVEFGNSVLARGVTPFLEKHPLIEMGFIFSHDLLKPLLADELDLMIDCRIHAREDLWSKPLFRERYLLAASPRLLKAAKIRHLSDLSRVSWLSLDEEGDWWKRFLVKLPSNIELNPPRLLPVNHLRGIINMAVSGAGLALVPEYSVRNELREGSLKSVFPDVRIQEDRFSLYCRKGRQDEPNIAAFTKFVKGLRLVQG